MFLLLLEEVQLHRRDFFREPRRPANDPSVVLIPTGGPDQTHRVIGLRLPVFSVFPRLLLHHLLRDERTRRNNRRDPGHLLQQLVGRKRLRKTMSPFQDILPDGC